MFKGSFSHCLEKLSLSEAADGVRLGSGWEGASGGCWEVLPLSLQISGAFCKYSVQDKTGVFQNFIDIRAEGDGSNLPPSARSSGGVAAGFAGLYL